MSAMRARRTRRRRESPPPTLRFRSLATLGALALTVGAACEWQEQEVGWSFERMIDQRSFRAYEPSGVFSDSMVMRAPPEGTVHRAAPAGPAEILTGRVSPGTGDAPSPTAPSGAARDPAAFVERIPLRLTMADLERGRERFGVYCAVCHGIDGSGRSAVADNMTLRKPPSLHERRLREAPAGRIFAVVTEGYGFMPSYAAELPVRDRWSVVAYVRALQLARHASLADLPTRLRREFEVAVP